MSFDNSRFTFDARKNYSGVVMEQGRVQMDADWNEWLAELNRRIQAGTLDLLGQAVYPPTTPFAFQITATTSGGANQLTIGPGRMYVDGLLAENHGDPSAAVWDPALAELSNSPQPPPSAATGAISYTSQPYLPGATIPAGGPFLAYLDVWVRPVTYIEDADLVDKAVGVDSTGRLQTVWQVKLMPAPQGGSWTCSTPVPWPQSAGLLSTAAVPSAASGPCCLNDGSGYTGMENQFYRVEIHQPGAASAGGATFKWSRDNASVMTAVTAIASVTNSAGNPASQLAVVSLGRDQVLGFAPGNWIEVLDDALELNGQPGEMCQIDTVDVAARTLTLTATLSTSFPLVAGGNQTDPTSHVRIRRWDQAGKVYESDNTTVWADLGAAGSTGDIPVPPSGTTLILENGVTISFDVSSAGGSFLTGDFWTFAARTADGSVETLQKAPPRGIHHHYARLAVVDFSVPSATDCRTPWGPPSSEECGCCCTCTVGDGVESFGKFTSIQQAINSLPASGGEVCILRGRYFENIFIENRKDIVLHGCGWQTRIASASLQPPGNITIFAETGSAAAAANTFAAVITVQGCEHVELRSFCVEAAAGEVGILLDGSGNLAATPPGNAPGAPTGTPSLAAVAVTELRGVMDTIIHDLVLTASTRPAILAERVRLLRIEENRIAMANVLSQWPAVWVSGVEIHIDRNWVGIQSAANNIEWLPASVAADLSADASSTATDTSSDEAEVYISAPKTARHPGGIQIAGPSQDVFVVENEIEGGRRNGITLGSFTILDSKGNDTGATTGVIVVEPGPCDSTVTLEPGTPASGSQGTTVVAGGRLLRILIARNRIRNTGLCGIGPVGFFDLVKTLEVITIEDLTIASNTISSTLLGPLAAAGQINALVAYGAICVPDVLNLIVRDNTITDFGASPGEGVCGIFVLHGEMVEISRNHVIETRDWTEEAREAAQTGGARAGIMLALVEPPTLTAAYSTSPWAAAAGTSSMSAASMSAASAIASPVYEPGLPALRVEHNVVRVPLGETLAATGFGPFSIVNNHFGCGGTVRATGTPLAQTVLIMNLGKAIESAASAAGTFSSQYTNAAGAYEQVNVGVPASPSSGGVLFAENICQLETRASRQRAYSSVFILSLDHLTFNSNHCWIDGPERAATVDAALMAGTIQVTSNRFQEAIGAVQASGLSVGTLNVTTQNISTYCLYPTGTLVRSTDNLAVVMLTNPNACNNQ